MRNRRLALVLSFLLLLALLLSGCVARPLQGELAQSAAGDALVIDLPAITIEYNEEGQANVEGLDLSALGIDLAALNRSPEDIQTLTAGGIQHVFVNLTPAGISLYANGKQLPSLEWTPETLGSVGTVLGLVAPDNAETVGKLLPLASNVSLGIVMRFPASGQEVPLIVEPNRAALQAAQQQAFQAAIAELGLPPLVVPIIQNPPPLTIQYANDGSFQLLGLAPFITAAIPPDALAGLKLPEDQIDTLQEAGIESINLKTAPDGLTVAVNGTALPTLTWDSGEIENLISVGVDGGVLKALAGVDDELLGTIKGVGDFAPILQAARLDITVNVPAQ